MSLIMDPGKEYKARLAQWSQRVDRYELWRRRTGAAGIVKALVERGAVGLITTQDLALTQIVEEVRPPGANFHFEDQLVNGKPGFDCRLQPGVVKKTTRWL